MKLNYFYHPESNMAGIMAAYDKLTRETVEETGKVFEKLYQCALPTTQT
jgi:hypothetical protein